MASKEKMTGIRLSDEQSYKIRYIAEQHHRKLNDEFRLMVDNHIKLYELENGEIKIKEQAHTYSFYTELLPIYPTNTHFSYRIVATGRLFKRTILVSPGTIYTKNPCVCRIDLFYRVPKVLSRIQESFHGVSCSSTNTLETKNRFANELDAICNKHLQSGLYKNLQAIERYCQSLYSVE